MPIRPEHRFFYPIDWPQLSAVIRFRRAGGCCEGCGRPHGQKVYCLSYVLFFYLYLSPLSNPNPPQPTSPHIHYYLFSFFIFTNFFLSSSHLYHYTSNNSSTNLSAFCQRCHMNHDRSEHHP
ncbi:hypothetical protein, partial [Methylobacterium sp. J-070]|uniref:hypothetical protein n=1 Tax=Methylobacterium sp. J-070 TaxID=2836650 RepID=UPI001FB989B3